MILAAGPHVGLAAGSGVAFGTLGAHAEIRYEHFAAFAGAGYDLHLNDPGGALAFAGRARYLHGDGEGLLLTLDFATAGKHLPGSPSTAEYTDFRDIYVGLALGGRLRTSAGFFFEAAVGVALLSARQGGYAPASPPADCSSSGQSYSCDRRSVWPDVNIALGFEL